MAAVAGARVATAATRVVLVTGGVRVATAGERVLVVVTGAMGGVLTACCVEALTAALLLVEGCEAIHWS